MERKVLHLITELYPGGAERVLHDLVGKIDRARFFPVVAALDGRGEFAERIRNLGVEVYDLGAYSRADLGVIWRLRKLMRELSPDILHTHLIHSAFVGRLAARPLGIPVVGTSHIVERRPVWWHFWLDRLTSRWSRKTVCVSNAVREFQQSRTGLPEGFFEVIHNGIDTSRFSGSSPKAEAKNGMGWEDFSLTVGVLGRFDFQKGIDVFIRAVDLFIRNNPIASDGIRFAIAGYGEEESNLRSLVFSLGLDSIISFCGCQDAEKFLPALDLCVCPSRWEGFGLVPLEAMACGVPVISTDVDSLPEVLGGAARMVPPDSPEAIAEAIAEIIGNPSLMAGMIALGRERLELFTVEKMVRAYERMYESLFA